MISDDRWLKANLKPEVHREELGVQLPALPSADVQIRFTGMRGYRNLRQAFDFYQFVSGQLPQDSGSRYRLLDFGGGWGRVTRFFLREIAADRLLLVDCLREAIECATQLNPPYAVNECGTSPPLTVDRSSVDCCIAYSVFSHLSEQSCLAWLQHLGELLVPGGKLVFTTRGKWQIRRLRLHRRLGPVYKLFRRSVPQLVSSSGLLDQIEKEYDAGRFQFFPTGGGGELTEDFYGETWIPEQWLNSRYQSLGFSDCEFFAEFKSVNQCTFVLTK